MSLHPSPQIYHIRDTRNKVHGARLYLISDIAKIHQLIELLKFGNVNLLVVGLMVPYLFQ